MHTHDFHAGFTSSPQGNALPALCAELSPGLEETGECTGAFLFKCETLNINCLWNDLRIFFHHGTTLLSVFLGIISVENVFHFKNKTFVLKSYLINTWRYSPLFMVLKLAAVEIFSKLWAYAWAVHQRVTWTVTYLFFWSMLFFMPITVKLQGSKLK